MQGVGMTGESGATAHRVRREGAAGVTSVHPLAYARGS